MTAELHRLAHLFASYASQINIVAIALFIWKTAPRIDHFFESSKLRLAERSRNLTLLWAECELGRIKKLALLVKHHGLRKEDGQTQIIFDMPGPDRDRPEPHRPGHDTNAPPASTEPALHP
jgi:hypothetical protein